MTRSKVMDKEYTVDQAKFRVEFREDTKARFAEMVAADEAARIVATKPRHKPLKPPRRAPAAAEGAGAGTHQVKAGMMIWCLR
jgi:biotin carboxyl carrier protein